MARPDYERLERYFENKYPNLKEENLTKENLRDTLNEILKNEREKFGLQKTIGIEGYVKKDSALVTTEKGYDWIESSVEIWRKEKIEEINLIDNFVDIQEIKRDIEETKIESDFSNLKDDVEFKIGDREEIIFENIDIKVSRAESEEEVEEIVREEVPIEYKKERAKFRSKGRDIEKQRISREKAFRREELTQSFMEQGLSESEAFKEASRIVFEEFR